MSAGSPACIYQVLEGPIHEFVLTEISRKAVDELFTSIEDLHKTLKSDESLNPQTFMLIDTSGGIQPLNYAFKRMQPLIAQYPNMRKATVAMISPPNPLLTTVSMVTRNIVPVRFFKPQEREQALAWLRQSIEAKQ